MTAKRYARWEDVPNGFKGPIVVDVRAPMQTDAGEVQLKCSECKSMFPVGKLFCVHTGWVASECDCRHCDSGDAVGELYCMPCFDPGAGE